MRTLWLALLLLPVVGAQSPDFVQGVVFEEFVPLAIEDGVKVGGCGLENDPVVVQGQFEEDAAARWFRFVEGETGAGGIVANDPSTRTTCGTATWQVTSTYPVEQVLLRFFADREVIQAATLDINMIQTVRLLENGAIFDSADVFPPDEASRVEHEFVGLPSLATGAFVLAAPLQAFAVEWYFEDGGRLLGQDTPDPASGQEFRARVRSPVVQLTSTSQFMEASQHSVRDGERMTDHNVVEIPYQAPANGAATNVRVRVDSNATFSHVEAPDGTRYDVTTVLPPAAAYSPDIALIIAARDQATHSFEITIPGSILAEHGNGTYQVHFLEVRDIQPAGSLLALNGLVVLLPLVFAAIAYRDIAIFRREAFGRYKRAARNLMITLGLVLAYYVAVIGAAVFSGWYRLMAVVPPGREAVLLYIQVIVAIAAFVGLWLTGRELYRITQPSPPT